MQSTTVVVQVKGTNPKNVLYVGGLEETINEAILHSAFIAFGDIKDVNIPLDNTTGKLRCLQDYVSAAEPATRVYTTDNSDSRCAQPLRGREAGQALDSMPRTE